MSRPLKDQAAMSAMLAQDLLFDVQTLRDIAADIRDRRDGCCEKSENQISVLAGCAEEKLEAAINHLNLVTAYFAQSGVEVPDSFPASEPSSTVVN